MMSRQPSWQLTLILVAVLQVPDVLWLLSRGWLVQMLAATLLGALIGWQLRPAVRLRVWLLLPVVLLGWLTEALLGDGMPRRLVDQGFALLFIVSIWPDDPGQRRRRAIRAALKEVRRWSVGIPALRG